MREKIKLIGGLLLVLILVSMLFIPESNQNNDGKIHLRYWYVTGTKEEIPYHAKEYNSIQDSVVIDCTPLPWNEHEKKVLTSILSGDPPDIVNLISPVAKWASRLALVPLDKLIKKTSFDTTIFFPSLWKEMNWRNHTFAIPLYSASYAFFYNKKLFREAGLDPNKPPKTWDVVVKYAKLLTKKDKQNRYTQMGFIPNYGNVQTFLLLAWELGAKFLYDHGTKVNLTSPEIVNSLQWEVNYFNDYPIDKVSAFMSGFGYADQHGFISEKVAMMVLDNSFIDQIKLYNPKLDYGVSEIPTFKGHQTVSSTGSWWLAIPKGSKHVAAAWDFMKFSVSKKVQLAEMNSQKEILFPANQYAAKDSAFIKNNNAIKTLVDMIDYAKTPTIVPMAHDVFWREFIGAHDRAIHHIQTPKAALMQAQKAIQYQLDQAIEYDNYVMSKMSFGDITN